LIFFYIFLEPRWIKYANLAASIFDGLEILTVDIMVLKDGKEVIIEINDTASGFAAENKEADMKDCVELCVKKNASLLKKNQLQQIGKKNFVMNLE
jgi:glutathione synthase/RimK-type ligase-like ATP-grasp enzyme